MSDQMKGRCIFVFHDVGHFLHHIFTQVFGMGTIERCIWRETGDFQYFSDAQSIKFQPDIFPGMMMVRDVSGDLTRESKESLSTLNLIGFGIAFGVIGIECSCAGKHIVEQVMVAGSRTEGMRWFTLFPSKLIKAEVYKIFIWKNRKDEFMHKKFPLKKWMISSL